MTPQYSSVHEARAALRADLVRAMKAKETAAVRALRSALAALDNAEAVTIADDGPAAASEHVAGGQVGLGVGEIARKELTAAEVQQMLRAEIDERLAAAKQYSSLGQSEEAHRLRAEVAALQPHAAG